jgi:hypothetical protein
MLKGHGNFVYMKCPVELTLIVSGIIGADLHEHMIGTLITKAVYTGGTRIRYELMKKM